MSNPAALSDHVCEQARLSRDPRFDGLFFTAVTSTGIYCRPVCPAPTPRRENIAYYRNAAAAEAAGFRPCLRCRPELAPGDSAWRHGDAAIARALKLIDDGLLAEQPIPRWPSACTWVSGNCDACSSSASAHHRSACTARGACCSPSNC